MTANASTETSVKYLRAINESRGLGSNVEYISDNVVDIHFNNVSCRSIFGGFRRVLYRILRVSMYVRSTIYF